MASTSLLIGITMRMSRFGSRAPGSSARSRRKGLSQSLWSSFPDWWPSRQPSLSRDKSLKRSGSRSGKTSQAVPSTPPPAGLGTRVPEPLADAMEMGKPTGGLSTSSTPPEKDPRPNVREAPSVAKAPSGSASGVPPSVGVGVEGGTGGAAASGMLGVGEPAGVRLLVLASVVSGALASSADVVVVDVSGDEDPVAGAMFPSPAVNKADGALSVVRAVLSSTNDGTNGMNPARYASMAAGVTRVAPAPITLPLTSGKPVIPDRYR